jgi:spore maturation protein A
MINYIFGFIFIIGLVYAIITNRIDVTINALLQTPKEALLLFFDIYVALVFWGGIIEICKQSGLLKILTNYISVLLHPLFKKMDKTSEALQYMGVNIVSNLLSISSLGSSFGFKAMKELDRINNYDPVASDEMITFLLINSSGICIIPTIVMSVRNQFQSSNSAIIMPYVIFISFTVLVTQLLIDWMIRKNGKR